MLALAFFCFAGKKWKCVCTLILSAGQMQTEQRSSRSTVPITPSNCGRLGARSSSATTFPQRRGGGGRGRHSAGHGGEEEEGGGGEQQRAAGSRERARPAPGRPRAFVSGPLRGTSG